MITVEHVSRSYGSFKAVEDVSFTTSDGEIVGLLGHNGAGKTTIMKMLTGYLEPSHGSITIGGLDLAGNLDACQSMIGYLPENLPVYPEMVVVDYLHYCACLRGLQGDAAAVAVRDAVARTELEEKALDRIDTLSRGYKQRVGVAQAILHQPRVLILDEPTNGLDPRQTQHMRELIKRLAVQATVILSTHIMQEVDAVCDRVLILRNGRLAVDESLAELRRSDHVNLDTDADPDQLPAALVDICGASPVLVSGRDGNRRYRLPLPPGRPPTTTCGELARALVAGGINIFALAPEQRDLESVFRDVNHGGEVPHAA